MRIILPKRLAGAAARFVHDLANANPAVTEDQGPGSQETEQLGAPRIVRLTPADVRCGVRLAKPDERVADRRPIGKVIGPRWVVRLGC